MGIACNFGGFMLEAIAGRVVMQKILFTAAQLDASTALQDGLLYEIVTTGQANIISSWPASAVRVTGPYIIASLISGLLALGKKAKDSHRQAFSAGDAQTQIKRVATKRQVETPSWLLVTLKPIKSLTKALQKTSSCDIHVYGLGSALFSKTFSWRCESKETEGLPDWDTRIDVRSGIIRIKTGMMNIPPLYLVHGTATKSWALVTDSFMLNIARSQWDMPVDLAAPGIIHRDGVTSFLSVQQLPSHSYIELKKDATSWKRVTDSSAYLSERMPSFTL
jgi:hypothetical protein